MISGKDFEIKQIALEKNRMQDSLQTEINFFKREVARLAKGDPKMIDKNTDEFD